jgi:hypothetical protein
MLRVGIWSLCFAALSTSCGGNTAETSAARAPRAEPSGDRAVLRPLAEFERISDPAARSRELFLESTKVLLHPRCVNCHPADDVPRQGDHGMLHDPPVVRGKDDRGAPALECTSCHQSRNLVDARVPGAPEWHLAPKVMAWRGLTPAAVCAQLKDPKRNGGRTLAAIADHLSHDALVAWGWAPGHGRVPVPGTQAELGALVNAWIASGAVCPDEAKTAGGTP